MPSALGPLAKGYYERGIGMLSTGNYSGVIDQLREVFSSGVLMTPDEKASCAYMLARALYEKGDPSCVVLLREFASTNPASPLAIEAQLASADYFFFAHQWGAAKEAYDDMDFSLIPPARVSLYEYRKGLSMINCGYYNEARPMFASLEGSAEFGLPARYYMAYLDYIDGDYDRAYRGFAAVADEMSGTGLEGRRTSRVSYESEGIEPGYYMAQMEYERGDYEDAVAHARSLLQKRPVPELVPEMLRVAGLGYFKLDDYDTARGFLEQYVNARQVSPADDAVYALAVIEYEDGEYDTAAQLFSGLTDLNNDLAQSAYLYLGQIAVEEDDDSAAAMAFDKASSMSYDRKVTEAALYNYVAARTRGGNIPFSSAIPLLEEFLEHYPSSRYAADAEEYLAMAYYNDKSYLKALRSLEKINSPSEEVREAVQKTLYQLGVEAMNNGNPSAAVGYLERCASQRMPDRLLGDRASLWLGDAHYSLEEWNEAAQAYRRFISAAGSGSSRRELSADLPLARYGLAYTLMKKSDYRGAADAFRTLLSGGGLPSQLENDSRVRLADCLYYTGDYKGATKFYTEAVERGGQDVDYALYRRAVMYGLAGDVDRKISELDALRRRFPDSRWSASAMLEKARTYAALGRQQEAVRAFEDLRKTHRNSAEARKGMLSLAITYMETSKPDKAEEVYKEIIRSWPTSEEASLANEDLRRFYAGRGELPSYAQFLASVPNAPRIDADEMERLEYEAAEAAWSEEDDSAGEKLLRYVERYPDGRWLAAALLRLAEDSREAGDTRAALAYADRLLSSRSDSPQAPEALLLKGRVLEESGASGRRDALEAYRQLETRGGHDMAAEAYAGIMRTTDDDSERLRYSRAVTRLGGVGADMAAEAEYYEATSLLKGKESAMAEEKLRTLAANTMSLAGAKAAVTLGQRYLDTGRTAKAVELLTEFTDAGTPHEYWLARGFIALADAYHAQGKTYLAKEYLTSLRDNYPGRELDIHDMISTRLSKWGKK